MAEIAFEIGAFALEATRGTAVTPPTHYANGTFTATPTEEIFEPDESRGTLEQVYRGVPVRRGTEWGFEGGLDLDFAPFWLNMVVKGNKTTPTTPVGGTLSRLWEFVPNILGDDLESATGYFGDPGVQVFQIPYMMAQSMTVSSDASGTDGATLAINGVGQPWEEVADPTLPAQTVGDLITGAEMQVWMDVGSGIGTTEVTGRVVSAEHTFPTGVTIKHVAKGPGGNLGFTRTGRTKRRITTRLVVEFLDLNEYNFWKNKQVVKCRVRHNGPLIETGFYKYFEVDTYGRTRGLSWGELEGSNRTLEFTIESEYNAALGASFRAAVQNTRTTL